ncbi:MAG: hypothetical protein NVS4B12_20530 [Ktedonobacteraceae bacterium]
MKTNTQNLTSKLQITAVVLMLAGSGWCGGNFTPAGAPIWNYLLHCVSIVLLLFLCFQLFGVRDTYLEAASHIGRVKAGVSILAIVGIIGCIIMIVLGASNPNPNAVGVKTFADWFPTIMLSIGNFLWLGTVLFAHRGQTKVSVAVSE